MHIRLLTVVRTITLSCIALLVVLLLITGPLLNPIIQRVLPWIGQQQLDSQLSVASIHFNPFTLQLDIDHLRLNQTNGQPLASINHIHAHASWRSLLGLRWQLDKLIIDQPYARLQQSADGKLNWDALIARVKQHRSPTPSVMPRLLFKNIQIQQGNFQYTSLSPMRQPWQFSLSSVDFALDQLSSLENQTGHYTLRATLPDQHGNLLWNGHFALTPLHSDGHLELHGIDLTKLTPILPISFQQPIKHGIISTQVDYQADVLHHQLTLNVPKAHLSLIAPEIALSLPALSTPLRLRGQALDINAALKVNQHVNVTISQTLLTALQASAGNTPLFNLGSLQLTDIRLNPAIHHLQINTLHLNALSTQLTRNQHGQLNWPLTTASQSAGHATQPSAHPPVTHKSQVQIADHATPWTIGLNHFSVSNLQVGLQDLQSTAPIRLTLNHGQLQLEHLSWPLSNTVPIKLALSNQAGGIMTLQGSYQPNINSGQFDTRIKAWSLLPVAPLISQFARLTLAQADLSTQGHLAFQPAKTGLNLTYQGNASINHLSLLEADTGKNFLGWNSLSAHHLQFSLQPKTLDIVELVANQPYAKIIIYPDKTLNLQHIERSQAKYAPSSGQAHRSVAYHQHRSAKPSVACVARRAAKPISAGNDQALLINIHRIRIINGDTDFSDQSLPTVFATRIHDLNGVITGLSSISTSTSRVELNGKVDQFGSASLRGKLQPFHATDNTDLTLAFQNLEMSRLTPYSGKFAGRKIASGRLSATLEYRIHNRQLNGTNSFIINKLHLGERVDSKDALNLPLNLAITLLEDENGIINLNLPVSGNLDDPTFSYGGIIWQAIVNVLDKIVTAPFHALGHLFGFGDHQPAQITFMAGSSQITPPDQETLQHLAQALLKKPALTLGIATGWNVDADRPALQKLALRQQVAQQLGLHTPTGQDPGPIDPDDNATQHVLVKLYDTQSTSGYDGLVRSSGLHGTALFKAIIQQLRQQETVPDTQLSALGAARALAIHYQLIDVLHLPAQRIVMQPPQAIDGSTTGIPASFSLSTND